MSGQLTIGSLCTGYGGLDHAAEAAFGARTAWVSDIDKGACKILAHRYPDAPNIGDMTAVDWSAVEPVDVITGGTPCQDLSHAGRRAGMTEGTRSNLWVAMREAVAQIRPQYVVWENVRGAYSAEADSDLEFCTGCMGGGGTGPVLRALGRVLGDLCDLGYDAQWRGLRAADVGACHGRFRVFVVATNADGAGRSEQRRTVTDGTEHAAAERRGATAPDADVIGHERGRQARDGRARPADSSGGAVILLPTPAAADGSGSGRHNAPGHADTLPGTVRLLPTPAVNDMGAGKTVDAWDEWTDRMKSAHGNGNGHGASLSIEALRLLPTPVVTDSAGTRNATANRSNPDSAHHSGTTLTDALLPTPSVADAMGGHERRGGARGDELLLNGMAKAGHLDRFGQYAPAIARWETVTGLTAPPPTEPTGRGGAHRLSARFVEFMMGQPAGWITDVPGITRNEALKACGNGVVSQQAFAAIGDCLRADQAVAS